MVFWDFMLFSIICSLVALNDKDPRDDVSLYEALVAFYKLCWRWCADMTSLGGFMSSVISWMRFRLYSIKMSALEAACLEVSA